MVRKKWIKMREMSKKMLELAVGGNQVLYPERDNIRSTATGPRWVQVKPEVSLQGTPVERFNPFITKYPIDNTTRA
jgi:hypothetical protein